MSTESKSKVSVEFMGPISQNPLMEIDAKSLSELKSKLGEIPDIAKWLKLCAVAVNDKIAEDINMPLNHGDKVVILPPVCGG